MKILFSGMIAADPHQGGATWAVLQYVLGLRRLGHEVVFVEPMKTLSPRSVVYFNSVVERFGLIDHAALLCGRETIGWSYDALVAFAQTADLLINISGMLADAAMLKPIGTRVYLDLDPAFIQLWHASGTDMRFAAHTHFVTVGHGIGRPGCPIPTAGRRWIATAQPIVLSEWPTATGPPTRPFTTVGSWRGYGSMEYQGLHYGQKAHSLRRLIDLPTLTREPLLLAMGIHPGETADLAALQAHRWTLVDPFTVAGSPDDYRRFVQQSKGEFGIAKSGYVVSKSQWFSDRSAAYLASGRPVIAQNTGFDQWLPTGRGLFAFETAQDVVKAIEAINADYAGHCIAARQIAERFFDSDKVLPRLLREVGAI